MQKNQAVLFKNVKVMKYKAKLRNCPDGRRPKRQLKATPICFLFAMKGVVGITDRLPVMSTD